MFVVSWQCWCGVAIRYKLMLSTLICYYLVWHSWCWLFMCCCSVLCCSALCCCVTCCALLSSSDYAVSLCCAVFGYVLCCCRRWCYWLTYVGFNGVVVLSCVLIICMFELLLAVSVDVIDMCYVWLSPGCCCCYRC